MPRSGRVGTAVAAVALASTAWAVTGCSSHHPSSAATTTTSTTPAAVTPTVASAGPDGARELAAKAGCTHFDPLPLTGTIQNLGAVSAGTCTLGSDTVLFATAASGSAIPRALSAAAQLGAVAGVTVYAAVGPNWVAAGSTSPTKSLAAKIVAKLGGKVEQATGPSTAAGSP